MRKIIVDGFLTEDAQILDLGGEPRMMFRIRNTEGRTPVVYRCYAEPSDAVQWLRQGTRVLVDGTETYQRVEKDGRTYFNINVTVATYHLLERNVPVVKTIDVKSI